MLKKNFSTQNQSLRRIASLVSENRELKERYKTLSDSYARLASEVENLRNREPTQENESQPVRFELATVLFAEVKGLSDIIRDSADAIEYIDMLDQYFLRFQEILKKYDMVKVRSMGDNYVCAGGISRKNVTNPVTVTLAALEMLNVMDSGRQEIWSVNIGIHTGPVVTFIEGKDQTTYGLKGDTLNVVSRIASVGEKNAITVSATTYELVKELFDCAYTGCLPVKYHQKLELYSVKGIQKEYASGEKRRFSNEAFRTRFLLIQFGDLQEHILDLLENRLPQNRFYHNVKHTVDVVTESELIGWAEGLDDHQLLLLKTAALFHDTGHILAYTGHEERSAEIARETLPSYGYSAGEIDEICRIIMATKLPPKPADLLESIICDSDLDYLGRADFIPVSNALYEELKAQNKMTSLNEWNKMQLKFISSHQYFTETGRNLREVKKQEQIDRIKRLIVD
jgi:class 3 adenylate cyclase/predicted metal-dependent HD superfamily phosphohydrolase